MELSTPKVTTTKYECACGDYIEWEDIDHKGRCLPFLIKGWPPIQRIQFTIQVAKPIEFATITFNIDE